MASKEDLAKLPRRAIVAYALRCARRVQPLTRGLPAEHAQNIEHALSTLESLVNQNDWSVADADDAWLSADSASANVQSASEAARSAADAAKSAADAARSAAAWSATADAAAGAARSAVAASKSNVDAADVDYHCLAGLNLGHPGELGQAFDPTESGPLGPLWPDGVQIPDWYRTSEDDSNS